MLPRANSYEALKAGFQWNIPALYNIGVDCCDKWADKEPGRRAITFVTEEGTATDYSFFQLKTLSNQIANLLTGEGVLPGARVGILLPQSFETAAAHIAIYKMAAIAVPLFVLFGPDALQHRVVDAGIETVITNREGAEKLSSMTAFARDGLRIFTVDGAHPDLETEDFAALTAAQPDSFKPVETRADDPALIIYTSGTTGAPKGALHAHRVLLGHLPGMEMSHNFFPEPDDVIWTPADWAWIGGLLDVLLPALHHGVPVIARRFEKFTGEAAFELMSRFKVTNAFVPPTGLKMMRLVAHDPAKYPLNLRSVGSGGETLGAGLLDWGKSVLGVTINEFYGQTECNLIVSSCSALMDAHPGIMGRAVPGHDVAVIRIDGSHAPKGEQGMIAVKRGDPVMFLNYWNNPTATKAKYLGDWLVTGDTGIDEGDDWIRFVGRDDDVITSAGYRIGPGEIEDCLLGHEAVQMAAVVGKPDPARTEIVKAYIVLKSGIAASDALVEEIQAHVKNRLAAHEYPREIAFVDTLPTTTTGKIIRRELRLRAEAELEGEQNG